ncbi:hypothetical protein GQX74_008606 [Glossina fuscipes]|nr:hypothetical protein GQX74_008606 [Glossina fuscipes]
MLIRAYYEETSYSIRLRIMNCRELAKLLILSISDNKSSDGRKNGQNLASHLCDGTQFSSAQDVILSPLMTSIRIVTQVDKINTITLMFVVVVVVVVVISVK